MGLFGSSDDTEDANDRQANDDVRADVSALVDEIQREGTDALSDAVVRLEGSGTDRLVGARTVARLTRDTPTVLDERADRVIDALTDRALARPIADSLLSAAAGLRADGIGDDMITDGAIDALEEADALLEQLPHTSEGVPGGGASEVALATDLRDYADTVGGREQLAVEATGDSLEAVARALARKAELDPIDTLVDMRSQYFGDNYVGVDVNRGELRDATDPSLRVPMSTLQARITDGIALGVVVLRTQGTVSQLATLTGHHPYPE